MAAALHAELSCRRDNRSPADRLKALAARVSRLACAGRTDPESITALKASR